MSFININSTMNVKFLRSEHRFGRCVNGFGCIIIKIKIKIKKKILVEYEIKCVGWYNKSDEY